MLFFDDILDAITDAFKMIGGRGLFFLDLFMDPVLHEPERREKKRLVATRETCL